MNFSAARGLCWPSTASTGEHGAPARRNGYARQRNGLAWASSAGRKQVGFGPASARPAFLHGHGGLAVH